MKGQSIIFTDAPRGSKARAAGPCEVTKFHKGEPVAHYVIPAPGEAPQDLPLPKVGPMNRKQAIAAGKAIDQSLVSATTHAKRKAKNRTFTARGYELQAERERGNK